MLMGCDHYPRGRSGKREISSVSAAGVSAGRVLPPIGRRSPQHEEVAETGRTDEQTQPPSVDKQTQPSVGDAFFMTQVLMESRLFVVICVTGYLYKFKM